MEMNGEGERVCVTGASGYIASWIIKLLLQRGYTVNATVRRLNDPAKTQHLYALDGAKERLKLFEANLLEDGSFDSAFHGCHGVFHVASPIAFHSPNPQADIIDPAVKGTLNVLASCLKAPVKRVIVTSSTAAVQFNGRPLTDQTVIDETWFSSPQVCTGLDGKWYLLSKTLAEDAAWKFTKENGIDMVVINPAMVLGPMLQPTLNFSTGLILSFINAGLETYPNASFGWIHVKDVAEAHIRAYELLSANGRYVMSESVLHVSQVINIIQELYPNEFKLPTKCGDDRPFEPTFKISMDKVRSLGLDNYIPFRVGLKETIECFKEKKFLV